MRFREGDAAAAPLDLEPRRTTLALESCASWLVRDAWLATGYLVLYCTPYTNTMVRVHGSMYDVGPSSMRFLRCARKAFMFQASRRSPRWHNLVIE